MFCIKCGSELPENANFCALCGTAVKRDNNKINSTKLDNQGGMIRCPNCGSNISRMDATCSFCGAHIVDKSASITVAKFAEQLMKIEEEAPDDLEQNTINNPLNALYPPEYRKTMAKAMGSKTFERKISLIKSFPIPNTVEEISEFILLAEANINVDYGKKTLGNRILGKHGAINYTEVTLATTWINKMEQAYHKAEIAFPNDPIFPKIKEIYENKMRELKRL